MLNPKYGLSLHKNKPHKQALGSTHTKSCQQTPQHSNQKANKPGEHFNVAKLHDTAGLHE